MDFAKIIPSILWGFLVFTIFSAGMFASLTAGGISWAEGSNTSMPFTNTISIASNISSAVETKGTDTANTFFPALPTIYQVWSLIKTALNDVQLAISNFFGLIGLGPETSLLVMIIWATISIGLTFIILAILFRFGGTKNI